MAEIRVEPKRRSLAWLWILLALAVVAAVAWYLMNSRVRPVDTTDPTTTAPTSALPAAGAAYAAVVPSVHPLVA